MCNSRVLLLLLLALSIDCPFSGVAASAEGANYHQNGRREVRETSDNSDSTDDAKIDATDQSKATEGSSEAEDADSNADEPELTEEPSTTTTTPPEATPDLQKFTREMLDRHNHLRRRHCVAPLNISEGLTHMAEVYSQKMAKSGKFKHNPKNAYYGENVWYGNFLPTGTFVTDDWYSEISSYKWNKSRFSEASGHFTQVVWEGSYRIGINWARSPKDNGDWYVTAYYDPNGNIPGEFKQNVHPATCSSKSIEKG